MNNSEDDNIEKIVPKDEREAKVEEEEKLNHIQTDFESGKPETKKDNPLQHSNDFESEISSLEKHNKDGTNKSELEIKTNFPSEQKDINGDIMKEGDCRCGSIQGKDEEACKHNSKNNIINQQQHKQQQQHKLHRNHAKHLSNRQRKEIAKQERKKRREETKKDPSTISFKPFDEDEQSGDISPNVPQDIQVISI